jgi:xanthine/CO dehydrogenase XdhC/CoxF family maturation factor
MRELYVEMDQAVQERRSFAVATIIATKGSTPRKTGAKMLVFPGGRFLGTIGGGCGEGEVLEEALNSLKDARTRIVHVDLMDSLEADDRVCGGTFDVFVEPVLLERN